MYIPDPKKRLHLTSMENITGAVIHHWLLLEAEPKPPNGNDHCCVLYTFLVLSQLFYAETFLPLRKKRANNRTKTYIDPADRSPLGSALERFTCKRRRGCSQRTLWSYIDGTLAHAVTNTTRSVDPLS